MWSRPPGLGPTKYTYDIFQNPPNFSRNQDGNYIYAKLINNLWTPIYIGQGCLSDRCCDQHQQARCIASKGATHVHAHLNDVEALRKAEEKDLLARYTNAYVPNGCNEREGG